MSELERMIEQYYQIWMFDQYIGRCGKDEILEKIENSIRWEEFLDDVIVDLERLR